jgi:hypothetical protein
LAGSRRMAKFDGYLPQRGEPQSDVEFRPEAVIPG